MRNGEHVQSNNQFSIDLERQKARAKRLLKAIRQGDEALLADIQTVQTKPTQLNADDVKLSHVQFYIARQLGLPSWAKLKAHVDELTHHRQAIEAGEPALDSDMKTLHIRCGHDIQDGLKQSGFRGDFLAMIDPLCMGPIPESNEHFVESRAAYVSDTLFLTQSTSETRLRIIETENTNINVLLNGKHQRLVFWVEHDSYDQFMLLRALSLLGDSHGKIVEIIEVNNFPGTGRFIGFGQLPTEAIRSCWKKRKPVTAKLYNQAHTAWTALRSNTPERMVSLLQHHLLDNSPNMANALKRHLQELPHEKTGLSMTQYLGLKALETEGSSINFGHWFKRYQQLEPLPTLGDSMFYALLLPLSQGRTPLINIENSDDDLPNREFSLTSEGEACLCGQLKMNLNYYVAGVSITANDYWTWDHQDLRSLRHCCNS